MQEEQKRSENVTKPDVLFGELTSNQALGKDEICALLSTNFDNNNAYPFELDNGLMLSNAFTFKMAQQFVQ